MGVQNVASTDHTTLLLNCYTKLKDIEKLDKFLKAGSSAEGSLSLKFDVETAIKVGKVSIESYTVLLIIAWEYQD